MTTPLFSTFRQRENRVTATFLAVLERLSLSNINRILQALLGEATFSLVTLHNQPKQGSSTPDAKIGTGPAVWIETKTTHNTVNHGQLERHLESLGKGEFLLLLTPDHAAPSGLDPRVAWSSFDTLAEIVQEILDDDEPPYEMEAYLLRGFISMLRHDGLLGYGKPRVIVVAANQGWPMYKSYSVYRCPVHRRMDEIRPTDRIAFQADGEIKPLVPKIKSVINSIDMMRQEEIDALEGEQKGLAKELWEKIDCRDEDHKFSGPLKIMFLTGPDDDETVKLDKPIFNDKKNKHGKTAPFTYGTRYVLLDSLKEANTTTELERLMRE